MAEGLGEIAQGFAQVSRSLTVLRERVDYIHVATMRGDPRFCKDEHADPAFDGAAFDADWERRGKRVPTLTEVFGDG